MRFFFHMETASQQARVSLPVADFHSRVRVGLSLSEPISTCGIHGMPWSREALHHRMPVVQKQVFTPPSDRAAKLLFGTPGLLQTRLPFPALRLRPVIAVQAVQRVSPDRFRYP
jgi:hypothetical protein